jgi:electron transport complex protein RnfG
MAKKAQSTLVNMILSLTIIAVVSAAALALLNNATKDPIAKAKADKVEIALKEVLPEYDTTKLQKVTLKNDKDTTKFDSIICKLAYDASDSLVGVAVESFSEDGFSGHLGVMVGFDAEGNITGYNVLETQETPGLGEKAKNWFKPAKYDNDGQEMKDNGRVVYDLESPRTVIGKNPGKNIIKVRKDKGEVDAITAATISSRAFCDAINRAYKAFNEVKGGTTNE